MHPNTASVSLEKGTRVTIHLMSGAPAVTGVIDGLANAPVPSIILESKSTLGEVSEVNIIPIHAIARIAFAPSKVLSPTSSDLLHSNLTKL